jgi:hypothetical protein
VPKWQGSSLPAARRLIDGASAPAAALPHCRIAARAARFGAGYDVTG